MPSDSLEDRIRELCAKVSAAKDTDDLESILLELKAALHEHSLRTKELIAERTRMLNPTVFRLGNR